MDWNADGRKDLLVGEFEGYIRVYLNTGTNASPLFGDYSKIKIDETPFVCGHYSTPYTVDWNNDQKKDVLCGEYYGTVFILINQGTNASPLFTSAVLLKDGGNDLDVGHNSCPVACDWDRDGRKDLLVGNVQGTVYWFKNRGTDAEPRFDGAVLLDAGGEVLRVERSSHFDLCDWDCDGTLDLVCGYDGISGYLWGGVNLFRGLGALSASGNTLAAGSGGRIELRLRAGIESAGRQYILLASASGTEPGIPLPGGAVLPLNDDAVLRVVFQHPYAPAFAGFRGILDGLGEGTATLDAPHLPLVAGTIVHFAYTTAAPYDYQSNALAVEILP